MGKQQKQEGFIELTPEQSLNLTGHTASAFAVLIEPFINYSFGKNYFRKNLVGGGIVLMTWVVLFPRHEEAITQFGIIWSVAVFAQVLLANFNHFFGNREITVFCGYPFLSWLMPTHFSRRLLNPLLTLGVGFLIDDRALSLLFKGSAIGQCVVYTLMYAIQRADDDARSDAMLNVQRRR